MDSFFQNGRMLGDYVGEGLFRSVQRGVLGWWDPERALLERDGWRSWPDAAARSPSFCWIHRLHIMTVRILPHRASHWGQRPHLRLPGTFTMHHQQPSLCPLQTGIITLAQSVPEGMRELPPLNWFRSPSPPRIYSMSQRPPTDHVRVLPPTTKPEPANTFVLELEPEADSILRPEPITRSNLESKLWNQSTQRPAKDH